MRITSSSTSSSEARPPGREGWAGFGAVLLGSALAAVASLWAGLVWIDPYDTGRFRPDSPPRVLDQGARTSAASRGRDPGFDGALIGNSHLQLVAPAALSEATGIPFVSLTVAATGAREQLAVLDWFLAHRRRPVRALVVGTDDFWCTDDPAATHREPFPFWLYGASAWRYASGLLRYSSFDAALRRLVRTGPGRARRDGYADFERDRRWDEATRGIDLAAGRPSPFVGRTGRFPMVAELARRIERLPADVAVVLVRPPVYVTALPEPGSALAGAEEACRRALLDLADRRDATELVDRRLERPENRDPANFFDHDHFRGAVARGLERDVADALLRARADALLRPRADARP